MSTTETAETKITPRLLEKYRETVVPAMQEEFKFPNPMMMPRLQKIVINMGIGRAIENKKRLEEGTQDLTTISGQKPVITKARQSLANFKLREGNPIGCAVTLRGDKMWEFMDRLITVAIPRIRDFRGLKTKLDGRGNYTMGLAEQSVFPEIQLDKIEFVQGMDITFVTTAANDQEGFAVLKHLGLPFKK